MSLHITNIFNINNGENNNKKAQNTRFNKTDLNTFEKNANTLLAQYEESLKTNNTELFLKCSEHQLYGKLNIIAHLAENIDVTVSADKLLKSLEEQQNKFKHCGLKFEKLIDSAVDNVYKQSLIKYDFMLNSNKKQTDMRADLLKEIKQLESKFITNMESTSTLRYEYKIPNTNETKYINAFASDIIPIIVNNDDRQLRKDVYYFYKNKDVAQNLPLLTSIIEKRNQLYNDDNISFYDKQMETSFVNNSTELSNILMPYITDFESKNNDAMKKLTKYACDTYGIEKIEPWDIYYIKQKYNSDSVNNESNENAYAIDKFENYSALPKVLDTFINFYSSFMNYEFESVTLQDNQKWTDKLYAYDVYCINDPNNRVYLGCIYFDLFKREHKASNIQCLYGLFNCSENGNLAVVSTHFKNEKSTLSFKEFETLLHEFGHAIHYISCKYEFKNLGNFDMEWDFIEVPSTFFEQFSRDIKLLETLGLPVSLINNLREPNISVLFDDAKLCALTMFDKNVHSIDKSVTIDTEYIMKLWWDAFNKYTLIDYCQNGTLYELPSFHHIFGYNYEGKYYSYLIGKILGTLMYKKYLNDNDYKKNIIDLFQYGSILKKQTSVTILNKLKIE